MKYYIVDDELFLNFHGQIIEFDTVESAFAFLESIPNIETVYYGEVHYGTIAEDHPRINLTGKLYSDLEIESQN